MFILPLPHYARFFLIVLLYFALYLFCVVLKKPRIASGGNGGGSLRDPENRGIKKPRNCVAFLF